MALVHEWAKEVASVLKEHGYDEALARRNELQIKHKWTTATYVVFCNELRKIVREDADQ